MFIIARLEPDYGSSVDANGVGSCFSGAEVGLCLNKYSRIAMSLSKSLLKSKSSLP
jgi:hypothetical protein